jgi:hypothetical protein
MTERSPGQAPHRRTARIPRPRRADHDHLKENPDNTTSKPTTGLLVRHLTDPAIEEAIQAFVDTAPPMSEVKRAKLARLLGTDRCHYRSGD